MGTTRVFVVTEPGDPRAAALSPLAKLSAGTHGMRRLLAVLKRRSQPVSLLSGRGTALQPARAERRFGRGNVGTAEHSVRAAVGNLARAKGESCEHRAVVRVGWASAGRPVGRRPDGTVGRA